MQEPGYRGQGTGRRVRGSGFRVQGEVVGGWRLEVGGQGRRLSIRCVLSTEYLVLSTRYRTVIAALLLSISHVGAAEANSVEEKLAALAAKCDELGMAE